MHFEPPHTKRKAAETVRCYEGVHFARVRLSGAEEWTTFESQEHQRRLWTLVYLGQPWEKNKTNTKNNKIDAAWDWSGDRSLRD